MKKFFACLIFILVSSIVFSDFAKAAAPPIPGIARKLFRYYDAVSTFYDVAKFATDTTKEVLDRGNQRMEYHRRFLDDLFEIAPENVKQDLTITYEEAIYANSRTMRVPDSYKQYLRENIDKVYVPVLEQEIGSIAGWTNIRFDDVALWREESSSMMVEIFCRNCGQYLYHYDVNYLDAVNIRNIIFNPNDRRFYTRVYYSAGKIIFSNRVSYDGSTFRISTNSSENVSYNVSTSINGTSITTLIKALEDPIASVNLLNQIFDANNLKKFIRITKDDYIGLRNYQLGNEMILAKADATIAVPRVEDFNPIPEGNPDITLKYNPTLGKFYLPDGTPYEGNVDYNGYPQPQVVEKDEEDIVAVPINGELVDAGTGQRVHEDPPDYEVPDNIQLKFDSLLGAMGDATRKFPFSIPWDLKKQLEVFNVTPQAPVFDVNIPNFVNIDGLNIPLKFKIDLSYFDGVAAIARWFLTITIDIAFILMLRRLMPE